MRKFITFSFLSIEVSFLFKRLSKVEDYRLLMAVARLNNNSDFLDLRKYLLGVPAGMVEKLRDRVEDDELHRDQGALQLLADLENLFENAHSWAEGLYNLELKKRKVVDRQA